MSGRPVRHQRRWLTKVLVTVLALGVVVAATEGVIGYSDGAFSGDYPLRASFAESQHGLYPGSEVVYHGVQVGQVSAIHLVQRRAVVTMEIQPRFRVPAGASAVIEPINVFGADQVSLAFRGGSGDAALRPGATITRTSVQQGLDGLFSSAVPLLQRIDTRDLSTVLSTLAQASQGEGPTIARSIDEGAKLAAFLDQTLPAQIAALDAFDGFAGALAPTAGSFDAISTASNRFLPTITANRAAYARLMATLTPFADNLTQFLSAYHPSIMQLLADGADVSRLVVADQSGIGDLIRGLAVYEGKIGGSVDPAEILPNGTEFGYFDVFITLGSLNQLICSLLDPGTPGSSFLAPLQQALTGAGTPITCPSSGTAPPSPGTATAGQATSPSAAQAARNLSTDLYGILGQPQPPGTSGQGGAAATTGGSGASGSGAAGSGAAGSGGSSGSQNALQSLLGGLL